VEPAEYRRLHDFESWYWWFVAHREHLVSAMRALKLPRHSRVLDAGCGTGRNLSEVFRRFGFQSYGVDFSPQAARCWNGTLPVHRILASVNELPFANSVFDAVFSVDVLGCRGVDLSRSLLELRRVLRLGGHLILMVPACPRIHSAHDLAVHSVQRFTRRTLSLAVKRTGFRLTQIKSCYPLFFPVIAGVRVLGNAVGARGTRVPRSDLRRLPAWLNRILASVASFDRRLAEAGSFSFGTSLLMSARRSDE